MRKFFAFLKRDLLLALTYRFSFLIDIGRTLAVLVSFFFIGKLFKGAAVHSYLSAYGGDYFRYVFLGIAFSGFMTSSFSSLSETVAFEKGHGTLEAILLTPTSLTTLALSKTLWDLALTTGKVALYLLLGAFLFRADLSHANWIAAVTVAILTVGAFFGLGMISAGCMLLFRETGLVDLAFGGISRFLAGMYFPITVFPRWLQAISAWIPLTYTLEAARKSLILGTSLSSLKGELAALFVVSLLGISIGFGFFRWSFQQAQRQGSLGFN